MPRLHSHLNGSGIYEVSICPGLISAAQSVDVDPALVLLLFALLSWSLYIWGSVAFSLQHKTDHRQVIEEATSLDFTRKQSISTRVFHYFPITENIWPLCTSSECLRIWSHSFCLPFQCVLAPSEKWQKIQFMFNTYRLIDTMLYHRHTCMLTHTCMHVNASQFMQMLIVLLLHRTASF